MELEGRIVEILPVDAGPESGRAPYREAKPPEPSPEKPAPENLPAVSDRKLAANRANAKKSTGPRTAEGKARSAKNAVRHALLADVVGLVDEDFGTLCEFEDAVHRRLKPKGAVERFLADRIVVCAWRLRRALSFEFALTRDALGLTLSEKGGTGWDNLAKLGRYEVMNERAMYRAIAELRVLQAERGVGPGD